MMPIMARARADHTGAVGADQALPASVPVAAKVTLDFQHVLDGDAVGDAYAVLDPGVGRLHDGVGPGPSNPYPPRAVERMSHRSQSWYFDLRMIADYVTGGSARAYHHTAPISMIYGLHAGLGAVLEEGLEAAHARHRECGEKLQSGLEERGFELVPPPAARLPQITPVWVPQSRLPSGMTEADVRQVLLTRYNIEVGGGLGAFAGRCWRIGLMGHTARLDNVSRELAALDEVLVSIQRRRI